MGCQGKTVPRDELQRIFGTQQPTREMVERSEELAGKIDRGQGIYIITYRQDQPDEIYFAGDSYD